MKNKLAILIALMLTASLSAAEFHVADPAAMPPVEAEVVLWGDDPELRDWLAGHGIRKAPTV